MTRYVPMYGPDLTFLGVLPLGGPACNDGTSFWVVNGLRLSRF